MNPHKDERAADHIERLLAMVADDGETWDLSPNDKAAIEWALKKISDGVQALSAEPTAPRISQETFTALWKFLVATKDDYDEMKGSNSLDIPVEFMELHYCAERDFVRDSEKEGGTAPVPIAYENQRVDNSTLAVPAPAPADLEELAREIVAQVHACPEDGTSCRKCIAIVRFALLRSRLGER